MNCISTEIAFVTKGTAVETLAFEMRNMLYQYLLSNILSNPSLPRSAVQPSETETEEQEVEVSYIRGLSHVG